MYMRNKLSRKYQHVKDQKETHVTAAEVYQPVRRKLKATSRTSWKTVRGELCNKVSKLKICWLLNLKIRKTTIKIRYFYYGQLKVQMTQK